MVGGAYVREVGVASVKLRAAYGKGVRPPETTSRATSWMARRESDGASRLDAEEQAGVEAGFDVLVGRALRLHVTRFDQTASGLIQPVAVSATQTPPPGGPPPNEEMDGRRIAYELQNIGEISNRGWELQGSAGNRGLTLFGSRSRLRLQPAIVRRVK